MISRITIPSGSNPLCGLPNRFCSYIQCLLLYEREYYSRFIKTGLKALLRESGINIREELRVLLGAGRVLKGIRVDDSTN